MPAKGLSLLGFMDQHVALHHLRNACVPVGLADDATLLTELAVATQKLGAPIANAGRPEVLDLPTSAAGHVTTLLQQKWIVDSMGGFKNPEFKLIEIEPLLAYQFSIDEDRSGYHCNQLASPPTMDELLRTCLPINLPTEQITLSASSQSILVKSKSLNVRIMAGGLLNEGLAGIHFGVSLALTQVVKLNGKYYLHNGFHRALGLRLCGSTHIPCLLREVETPEEAGIIGNGATFPLNLLESDNSPTLAHFTQGRSHKVSLRHTSRIIQVSWTDHIVTEE
jgi:hypothetical protein